MWCNNFSCLNMSSREKSISKTFALKFRNHVVQPINIQDHQKITWMTHDPIKMNVPFWLTIVLHMLIVQTTMAYIFAHVLMVSKAMESRAKILTSVSSRIGNYKGSRIRGLWAFWTVIIFLGKDTKCPAKSHCVNNEGSYICECDKGFIEGMGSSTDEYCTEGNCPGSCLDLDECDARTHKVKSNFHLYKNINPYWQISRAWTRSISGKLIQNGAFSRSIIPF